MTILSPRLTYLPRSYPWAYDLYKLQHQVHWLPDSINTFGEDVRDFKKKLTEDERYFVTQILKFFTQQDVNVASAYCQKYLPKFQQPELTMMLTAFAAFEGIHVDAYSKVIETLHLPESTYSAFLEYKEMQNKQEKFWEAPKTYSEIPEDVKKSQWEEYPNHCPFIGTFDGSGERWLADIYNLAYDIAKFSAFAEGLQLFSSFAMLMNFPRFNKMKALGSVVEWSIRDETIHVIGMSKIFQELVKDYPWLWQDGFKQELYKLARDMVELEFAFIDFAWRKPDGTDIVLEGLTKHEIKDYIKFVCNERLKTNLMLEPIYPEVKEHPLPWLALKLSAYKFGNFFEQKPTEYSKAGQKDNISEDDWK